MENLFVTFDLANKLKGKGFNEKCFAYQNPESYEFRLHGYSTYCRGKEILNIPTHQQCVDWFREKHGIEISSPCKKDKDLGVFYGGYVKKYDDDFGKSYGSNFRDYYEAYNHGIEEALKLI